MACCGIVSINLAAAAVALTGIFRNIIYHGFIDRSIDRHARRRLIGDDDVVVVVVVQIECVEGGTYTMTVEAGCRRGGSASSWFVCFFFDIFNFLETRATFGY